MYSEVSVYRYARYFTPRSDPIPILKYRPRFDTDPIIVLPLVMISGERQKVTQKAVRWPCGVCGRGVCNNSIQCTSCKKWVHRKCSSIKGSMYKVMKSFICSDVRAHNEQPITELRTVYAHMTNSGFPLFIHHAYARRISLRFTQTMFSSGIKSIWH